jgi:hypothetical protein
VLCSFFLLLLYKLNAVATAVHLLSMPCHCNNMRCDMTTYHIDCTAICTPICAIAIYAFIYITQNVAPGEAVPAATAPCPLFVFCGQSAEPEAREARGADTFDIRGHPPLIKRAEASVAPNTAWALC